jgi:hypothetical protein
LIWMTWLPSPAPNVTRPAPCGCQAAPHRGGVGAEAPDRHLGATCGGGGETFCPPFHFPSSPPLPLPRRPDCPPGRPVCPGRFQGRLAGREASAAFQVRPRRGYLGRFGLRVLQWLRKGRVYLFSGWIPCFSREIRVIGGFKVRCSTRFGERFAVSLWKNRNLTR